jgi:hypothetical protein
MLNIKYLLTKTFLRKLPVSPTTELTRTLRQLEIPLAPKLPILETRKSSGSYWEILTD